MFFLCLALAAINGLSIAWIDSRPTWDDTGITAGLLLLSAGVWTLFYPRRAWVFALAVGIWIPLNGVVSTHDPTMLLALIFPFIGAYAAAGIRKLTGRPQQTAR